MGLSCFNLTAAAVYPVLTSQRQRSTRMGHPATAAKGCSFAHGRPRSRGSAQRPHLPRIWSERAQAGATPGGNRIASGYGLLHRKLVSRSGLHRVNTDLAGAVQWLSPAQQMRPVTRCSDRTQSPGLRMRGATRHAIMPTVDGSTNSRNSSEFLRARLWWRFGRARRGRLR